MKKYYIENIGCDNTTKFLIELSSEELKTIKKFIKINNEHSKNGCMPKIELYAHYEYNEECPILSYGYYQSDEE